MSIAEVSKSWEGRTVDGIFVLGRRLGGSEQSAVFLTDYEGRRAAIKLVQAVPARTEPRLSHPHLIAIFRTGPCEIDQVGLLYIVMEYAEENLAQVLLDRPLTAAETRDMLEPTLQALAYIHGQGLVHGRLKPSNIMAVDDQLKLSSEGLSRPGEANGSAAGPYDPPERAYVSSSQAADVWSLGITLAEVLTQRIPAALPPKDLPEPFGEIAGHCLQLEAQDRWSIAQISNPLREDAAPAPARKRVFAPVGVLILVAVLAVLVLGVVFRHSEAGAAPPKVAEQTAPVATPPPEPTPALEPPKPIILTKSSKASVKASRMTPSEGSADQPMPDIPGYARSTIRGRVVVNVVADVDGAGAVTDARLDPPGGSRYFAERAVAAVRRWKFPSSSAPQQWRIRFEFQTTGTRVARQRLSP